jgi:hypothetical protein
MKKIVKNILYGFLSWLIPFAVSFLFYTKTGQLIIDVRFFKSIMIATGSLTAALLLLSYFRKISRNYLHEGILVGLTWLVLNLGLDLLVLVPMSGMSVGNYFAQIGLGYLVIPVMSIMLGKALANRK